MLKVVKYVVLGQVRFESPRSQGFLSKQKAWERGRVFSFNWIPVSSQALSSRVENVAEMSATFQSTNFWQQLIAKFGCGYLFKTCYFSSKNKKQCSNRSRRGDDIQLFNSHPPVRVRKCLDPFDE